MKKLNLLKLFLGTMLAFAATAFTGCVDDNDDTELPYLEVTPTTLAFDASGAPTEGGGKFVVKTNRPWQLIIDEKDMTWVRPSATSGKGSGEVSFNIPAEANGRMATLTFQVSNTYGPYLEQKVTITQGEGGNVGEVIYSTNIGTKAVSSAEGWPYADAYDDWQATGTGIANVTYSSSNVSVRNSGKSNIGAYDGASGPNVLFFSTAPAYVSINKIALTSTQTRLQLNFGGSRSIKVGSDYDNTFETSKFIVSLSADGTNWTPITYDINNGDTKDPFWVLATADFTLTQAVSELYMKFEATESSVFRMDDIKLIEGMGGQSVDLAGGSGALIVSPSSVSLGSAAGATATVSVTAAETWTAAITGSGFTIDKTTDAAGSSTVTVTASAENTGTSVSNLGTIVFTSGADTKTVTVSQQGTGGSTGSEIYYTNIGTKTLDKNNWPFADAYDDWQAKGSGSGDVTYTSSNVTVRNSGLSSAGAYEGASGPNVLFFGKEPAYVAFNNITLTSSQTKLQLTFGASRSVSNGGTYDNTFDMSKFIVSLSANGTDWTPITYTKNEGDATHPFWVLATADFTLSNAISAIYIKFEAKEASVFRLDDVKLAEGNGGQSVDLGGGSSSVLNVSPSAVSLANTAGATANVTVTATAGWTASTTGSGFTIDKMGADGNATVVVTAAAANTTSSTVQLGTIVFKSGAETKTVTVSQQAGGSTGDTYYHTGVGTKTVAKPYPFADAYDDWQATGSGIDNVSYTSSNVSIRATGKASTGAYEGASGPNVLFFGTAPASFSINNIAVPSSQTSIKLTFGASRSLQSGGKYDNTFDASKFLVSLSSNGTDWKQITYTKNNGDATDPFWVFATADFTLTSGVSAIYVKFEATEASVFRMDDITLQAGSGGQSVDLGGGSETPTLEVSPLDVTLGNTANATKTFTVTTTAAWTATSSGTGFTVNPTSGTGNATVTVTASAANSDSSEKTLGSVLVSATGVGATKTVNVKQAAGGGSTPAGTVVVDFTSSNIATPALPESSAAGSGMNTYTIGGLEYIISSGKYYFKDYSTESYGIAPYTTLYMQAVGYIQLPAIAGKMLTRIVATAAGNIGGSVNISVGGVDGSAVSGGETIVFAKPSVTFDLSGTQENTAYRINVEAKNAQFSKLELTYSDGGVTPPPTPEITAVNPTSLSFPKEGGNETIAVTVANQGANALSVSGLTSPFSASVSGNTVTVSAQANTGAAVNQTLTISVAGGNSMTVPVSIADGQGGDEPTGDWASQNFSTAAETAAYNTKLTDIVDGWQGIYVRVGAASTAYDGKFTGTPISFQVKSKESYIISGDLTGGIQAVKFESMKTNKCETNNIVVSVAVGGTTIWEGAVPVNTTFADQAANLIDFTQETAGFTAGHSIADLKGATFTIKLAPESNTAANSVAIGNVSWMGNK